MFLISLVLWNNLKKKTNLCSNCNLASKKKKVRLNKISLLRGELWNTYSDSRTHTCSRAR